MGEFALLHDLSDYIASSKSSLAKMAVDLRAHPHGNCMILRKVRHRNEGPHKRISSSHQLQAHTHPVCAFSTYATTALALAQARSALSHI